MRDAWMSEPQEYARPSGPVGAAAHADAFADDADWVGLRSLAGWVVAHPVLISALAMIAAQLIWKGIFLSHLYFRQDDYRDLDLAIQSPLSWRYLTSVEAGHLIIGLRIVAWLLARTTLYNWGLATAVSVTITAAADLAGYRALRTLFGDRPRILIPLALYLLNPLTIPDLGWWSAAMEYVPLQLATFAAVTAHVHYLRTRRTRHLAASLAWIAFGLIFFEKALVLPLLLLAITAAFMVDRRTFLGGVVRALFSFPRAWLGYLVLLAGYSVILGVALETSPITPQVPGSPAGVVQFIGYLLRDTFLPGALGGPWRWYPLGDGSYALAAPTAVASWLAVIVAVTVIAATILRRAIAWRSWAILAGWVFFADVLPVIVGRLKFIAPIILGLETRYVADAAPVLAICVGLALWPVQGVARPQPDQVSHRAKALAGYPALPAAQFQYLRYATAVLLGVVAIGSIWSVQHYEAVTNGRAPRTYIANAAAALRLAPRGTNVLDWPVPADMEVGLFGKISLASTVIGDME